MKKTITIKEEFIQYLTFSNNKIKFKDENISRNSIVEFKCCCCKSNTYKQVRSFIENKEILCSKCIRKKTNIALFGGESALSNVEKREKFKDTCRTKYGFDHPVKNKEIKIKIQKTNLEKYGEKNCLHSEKSLDTLRKKYGVDNVFKSKEIQKKIKLSNLEKYGVEFISQVEEVKNKIKKTCLEKYGVDNVSKSFEVQGKIKAIFLKKYGCSNPRKNDLIKLKIKETNLKKYGFEYIFLDTEKIRKSMLNKYGVEFPSQNKEILSKIFSTNKKRKKYNSIFGEILYQSKNEFLFIKYCEKNNIYVKNGPALEYYFNNKKHLYYVDFETQDLLIEIKGSHKWYFEDIESGIIEIKNIVAEKYCIENKKSFVFILDKNTELKLKEFMEKT